MTFMHGFMCACIHVHTVVKAQVVKEILDLQVVGGGERNGYIRATVLRSDGSIATGPICGTVDTLTAVFACNSKNLYFSSVQGTVSSIE